MAAAGLMLLPWGLASITAAQASPHTQSILTAGISLPGLGTAPTSSKHLWLPHQFAQIMKTHHSFCVFQTDNMSLLRQNGNEGTPVRRLNEVNSNSTDLFKK